MTDRLNELEADFMIAAFNAQESAKYNLGAEHFDEIKTRYAVDYRRTGSSLDILFGQWAEHLGWEPEPCPF